MSHVAFVIPGIDKLGGAEKQAIALAKGLVRREWRVSMIALSGNGGAAAGELAAADVEFLTLRMRKGLADPRGWVRLNRWLRRERPDVLHTHLPHATWMARGSRLLAPVRVVVDTVHTAATGPGTRRMVYRWTGWLADCVTAVSCGVADAYVGAGMVRADRMTVLPNGIELEGWEPGTRKECGLKDEFVWCAVGRLERVKKYGALLRAMAGLPETARLMIAGSGAEEVALRALAEELGVAGRVRFLGFQADVRPRLQAADGFVLSSLWEGLPVSLLEAGACGLPAVATDVAGVREVVADGETGFVAAADDVDSLRRAMLRLMQMRPENRLAMGMDARRRIEERFALESVLDRWEALYGALMERNARPRRWAGRLAAEVKCEGASARGAGAGVR